ncbi:hypothetical protein RISW2_21720 [Roseivivax isoporae LMG 25204]|uniref:Uncharacterized protein n=1 Tax=Roseivivax isoporae LMG 25204 TaxID=1449351 RepID=X7F3F1_9RHOB|nr:hypothetical protein RISW2_21720 [Roseivivax isoporae LMG 25204]
MVGLMAGVTWILCKTWIVAIAVIGAAMLADPLLRAVITGGTGQ